MPPDRPDFQGFLIYHWDPWTMNTVTLAKVAHNGRRFIIDNRFLCVYRILILVIGSAAVKRLIKDRRMRHCETPRLI